MIHPTTRAERLRIKKMKDTFDKKSKRSHAKFKREEIEAKELDDAVRIEVSGAETKAEFTGHTG